jgi:hypothetical protein
MQDSYKDSESNRKIGRGRPQQVSLNTIGWLFRICYISKDKKRVIIPKLLIILISFYFHFVKQIIMAVTSSVAQRIAYDILTANDEMLAISILDKKGNILATISKESFKEAFGVTRDGDKYGGSLAVAALSLVNQVRNVVGEVQAIITMHKDCKMMLYPYLHIRYWLD